MRQVIQAAAHLAPPYSRDLLIWMRKFSLLYIVFVWILSYWE